MGCAPPKTFQNQKSFRVPSKQASNIYRVGWAISFLQKNVFVKHPSEQCSPHFLFCSVLPIHSHQGEAGIRNPRCSMTDPRSTPPLIFAWKNLQEPFFHDIDIHQSLHFQWGNSRALNGRSKCSHCHSSSFPRPVSEKISRWFHTWYQRKTGIKVQSRFDTSDVQSMWLLPQSPTSPTDPLSDFPCFVSEC